LLLCFSVSAQEYDYCAGAGGAAAVSYACTDATHDSANNAITACEDFDGAVECTATYTSNCRATWTIVAGTPDYDNTDNKIEGTYSLYLDISAAANYPYKAVTAGANYYVYAHLNLVAAATAAKGIAHIGFDGAVRLQISIGTTGKLKVFHGTSSAETTSGLSAGNTYAVWYGYNQGTGADGYGYVAWAAVTGGTPPAKPTLCDPSGTTCADANSAVVANGSQTTTVNRSFFGTTSSDTTLKLAFDHIRINTTDFGSNVP